MDSQDYLPYLVDCFHVGGTQVEGADGQTSGFLVHGHLSLLAEAKRRPLGRTPFLKSVE
jgi:hypothetical protein